MARPTLPDSPPQVSLLRRVVSSTPIVLGVYALTALALGLDPVNPVVAAVGLAATGGGFAAGDIGIRSVTNSLDSLR